MYEGASAWVSVAAGAKLTILVCLQVAVDYYAGGSCTVYVEKEGIQFAIARLDYTQKGPYCMQVSGQSVQPEVALVHT